MLKRMIAWVAVMTMVLSLLPQITLGITAEESVPEAQAIPDAHSHSAAQHKCAHCEENVTWQAWGDTDAEKKALPKSSGHYYLVSDIEKTGRTEMETTADIVLCLNGYTVDGNSTDTIYRVVTSGKLRIDDCTAYTDAEGVYHAGKFVNGKTTGGVGGTFYVNGTSTLTMTAGIISDSVNSRTTTDVGYGGGALHLRNTAQVTLENVVFENCSTTKDGGVISKRDAGSKLTVKNCTFKDNSAGTSGGVAYILSGGATFENCTFTGNSASTGSVFYVRSGGVVTVKNCTFEGNTATGGASGVFYLYAAQVDLEGCTIQNNTAKGNGGSAIYMTYTTTVNIKDTTITGNRFTGTASTSRGAVYVTKAEDQVNLSGKVIIDDNIAAADGTPLERGIFLQAANQLDVGGLTDGSYVEIWSHTWAVEDADDIVKAEKTPTAWKRTWVVHENSGSAVEYSAEKGFYFALNTDHIHCQCGDSACTDTTHEKVEYLPWNTADALPAAGDYYLNTDVTLAGETNVTKDLNLCLNGHTVKAAKDKRHMSTATDAVVVITISDCTAKTVDGVYTSGGFTGGVDKGSGQGGGAIYIRKGGTLKIFDGTFTNNTSITGGGAINTLAGTKLVIYDGLFSGNTAVTADGKTWKNGGAVRTLGDDAQILGGTFTGNQGNQGGAIYSEAKKFVVKDVAVTDNYAYSNAGGIYAKIGDTTLRNVTFTGNYGTKDGGALYYREGKIHVIDCVFTDNECKTIGVGISFSGNAVATITGGTFTGGKTTSGGAVVVQGGASVTVNGGTYKDNTVTNYGGAFSLYNGSLTIDGGAQITGNTAKRGGAIDLRETSTLVLKDCTITGNTASSGGAVYINDKSTLTLEGAPQIMANQGGNLYLMDTGLVKVGTLKDTANVCVTGNPGAFTEACNDYADRFTADSKYLKVDYVDGALHLVAGGEHKHCLCGTAASAHCDHMNIAWVAWESTTALPTSGSYYLLNDVTLTDEVSISKDLNLCLNGHTITAAKDHRVLSTPSNVDVTISITDCTAATVDSVYTAGKLTGGYELSTNAGGGCIYLRSGGNLNLYEGKITGNTGVAAAGAMLTTTNTVFNMYGGEFSDNTAGTESSIKPGGAIYAMKGAKVNIYGGTFKNNSGSQGGAIWLDGDGSELMVVGGTFADNKASSNGAAIYTKAAKATISGGTFTGNISNKDGGAVYSREGHMDITGGTFSGNQSTSGAGGALSYSGANAGTISGAVFENNQAGSGGAMIIQGGSNVTIKDVTIRNNAARGYGGGIYLHASTLVVESAAIYGNEAKQGGAIGSASNANLTVKDGKFYENTATGAGGAMYLYDGTQAVISSGVIRDNTAGTNAGGVYGKQADLKITGGTISGNYGAKDGGGIYFREGNIDIIGEVLITGNTSKTVGGGISFSGNATGTIGEGVVIEKNVGGSGGGVIVQGGSDIKMTDGTIRNHKTNGYGGGVYVHNSTFTMTGGSVTGNHAKVGGGGFYVNQEKAKVIIDGGTISKNTTKNGGGFLVVNKAALELKSGKITGNTTQSGSGGGAYISTNTTFKMSGGTISGNTVTGAAGGVYLLRSIGTFTGGSITGNVANGAGGGGIYLNGATLNLYGTSITGNTTKGNGGGIGSTRNIVKKNGVETASYPCTINISGSYIANNSAKIAGGVIMNGNGGKLVMYGATITNNAATSQAGGLYVSSKCTATIRNTNITNNTAVKSGGGMYFNKPTVSMENSKVVGNTAEGGAGGGSYIYRGSIAEFKNVTFADNTCSTVGGGVYGDSNTDFYAETAFDSCTFSGNTAGTRGGGYYGSFGVEFDAVNCLFENNTAVGKGTEDTSGNGGAIAIRDIARLKDCTFKNNKAQKGGAFYGGNMQLTYSVNGWGTKADDVAVTMENCTFEGNDAAETGGAIHNAMSSFATLTDCSFTGNSAGTQGSAIYAEDDLKLIDTTITGNVSGSNGYALYYADSEFDTMNYIRGLFKLGGDIIVKDNQGGDAYLDNMVTITMTSEGVGPKTHIEVTLDKGVLTQRVIGAYHYEGGNQVYTITYGDRSLTEPEVDTSLIVEEDTPNAQTDTAKDETKSGDTWLYVGVGAVALVVLALVVFLIAKKKKTPAGGNKE